MKKYRFNIYFDDPVRIINDKSVYEINQNCYCIAEKCDVYESQLDIEGPAFSDLAAAITYAQMTA